MVKRPQGREVSFAFDPTAIASADALPEDTARLFWMFLSLIRKRSVDFTSFYKEFKKSSKTFSRDVTKLRDIGTRYHFALTRQRRGVVALANLLDIPDPRRKAEGIAADTLRAVADALGELVANDLLGYVDLSAAPRDPFLRIAMPQLVGQSVVADTYERLRAAWKSRTRVRFRYPARDAKSNAPQTEERTVEPHVVTYYDGRYYLVAYDRRPRTSGWRQFALDRIEGGISLAGTFQLRSVPRHYRGEDAVGLFKTGPRHEVLIAISPAIAQSVLGRRWQHQQRTEYTIGSWPTIAFEVFDLGEAVRWAFGFGSFARVVAPPPAVAYARELAMLMLDAHAVAESTNTA
jgi:predicted DNA-binding transcriptional regulator YafY